MRRVAAAVVLAGLALVGCHRGPRATYEYEPRVTITHTDAPPAAPAANAPAEPPPAAVTTTTIIPQRPSAWKRGGKF
jgi:hypothetical protein